MAETGTPIASASEPSAPAAGGRSKDDVALELMKFIAVTTGYGRTSGSGAGFSSKPATHASEEYAEALINLFQRCRKVVGE